MALELDKSFVTKKLGPMPVWAWMAVGLGAAVAYKSYAANRAKAKAATADQSGVQLVGGDQTPPVVFQSYTTVNTPVTVPPGSGRTGPPVAPPPSPVPIPIDKGPGNHPTPSPAPAPKGQWVTVSKWTPTNTPWNSTLWGIAQHLLGNGNSWTSVWNASENSALKARRKDPKLIQPGDKIFVPS